MLRYLFFLLFTLSGQLHAQSYLDGLQLGAYRHTITYADHQAVFQVSQINESPKKVDAKKKYFWFAGNQIQSTQGGYSGKLLHGMYTDFFVNKNLKEQGNFNMGLKEGVWKTWNEEGTLRQQINYEAGIIQGKYWRYTDQGILLETGNYKDGLLDGEQKTYATPDSTVTVKYDKGVIKPKKSNWVKKLIQRKN